MRLRPYQAPRRQPRINDMMYPPGSKQPGNVWVGGFIMNVPETSSSVPVTPTPTPSITPTSSLTPTPSITPTQTITPSITPTNTSSPTPSITPTQTITPTNTGTPTPTPTSSPLPSSVTYMGAQATTANQSSFTYSSVNIGGPGLIVIGISGERGTTQGNNLISGVTINGVNATIAIQVQEGATPGVTLDKPVTALAYLRITSGTTANITIVYQNGQNGNAINVWRIQNNISDTPIQTGSAGGVSTPISNTLTGLTTGDIVCDNGCGTPAYTYSLSGVTQDFQGSVGIAGIGYVAGSIRITTPGSLTITQSSSGVPSLRQFNANAVWR